MYLRFLPLLLLVVSCRNKKAIHTSETMPVTVVDSAVKKDQDPVVKRIYRASNTLPNDILHTKLEVSFDWQKSRLNGKATLKVKPWFYPVTRLALNARGMDINSVEVFEVVPPPTDKPPVTRNASKKDQLENPVEDLHKVETVKYTYDGDSLKIDFGRPFYRHEHYYVIVDYVAKPDELGSSGGSAAIIDDKGLYFVNPSGENPYKMTQLWTQGETQASSVWFPTVDSPNEKMTQEIFMTVEDKYVTLSNGVLAGSQKQANGMRTDHWVLSKPHAPYLAMMAVGEFVKVVDEPWNGKEISYYVEKEYADHAKAIFGETRSMIDFYSRILNYSYPWEKYAQIVARDYVSGAMENTTATLHGDFMVYQTSREILDGRRGTAVIAHELFHQWFGNVVTTESWSNLPLNESFATYGEYLWEEHSKGRDAADEHSWQSRMGYFQTQQEVDLIRFEYKDKEDMFDAFSYNKGGQVLHMLRKTLGDEAFFGGLNKYLVDNEYKPVEIHHLRLAMEEVSGRDLNWFFNQWFLNKGRPKLEVTTNYDKSSGKLKVVVQQKQDLKSYPLYTLPLCIDLYLRDSVSRHYIVIDDIVDTFLLSALHEPELVNFDAERQLLADIKFKKSDKEYLYQYKNAPLFMDRLEALQMLESRINDSTGFFLFTNAALKDRNATIRSFAISRLEKSSADFATDLKGVLTQVFLGDTVNTVRAIALSALNRRFMNDGEVANLTEKALDDKSYAVIAQALNVFLKKNPEQAMQHAKRFENERGRDIMLALAGIYANHGSDAQIPFFRSSFRYITAFDMLTFCNAYGKLGQRCSIPVNVLKVASDLELIGKGSTKYTRYATNKAIRDLYTAFDAKTTSMSADLETAKKDGKPIAEMEKELRTFIETRDSLKVIYERTRV